MFGFRQSKVKITLSSSKAFAILVDMFSKMKFTAPSYLWTNDKFKATIFATCN
jgi:hypothetical protein